LSTPPRRDVAESPFASILERLHAAHPQVLTAVFYDELGETIDYHSQLDPFETRLTAAHHGVVVCSALQRMAWLGFGIVEALEVAADKLSTVTIPVGSGTFLTVVTSAGELSDELFAAIDETIEQLRVEADL